MSERFVSLSPRADPAAAYPYVEHSKIIGTKKDMFFFESHSFVTISGLVISHKSPWGVTICVTGYIRDELKSQLLQERSSARRSVNDGLTLVTRYVDHTDMEIPAGY